MAAEEEFADRRGDPRIGVMASVQIDLGGAQLEATALDMSISGISVWAPQGIKPIGEFKITMTVDHRGAIVVPARLKREFQSDGGAVWGLAFGELPPEVAARIEAYLESR